MSEQVTFIELVSDTNGTQLCKLYVNFKPDLVLFHLQSHSGEFFEEIGNTFTQCLLNFLKGMPNGTKFKIVNQLFAQKGAQIKQLDIIEYISLVHLISADEFVLNFELNCQYDNDCYTAVATEDFSIALQKLQNSMNLSLIICAYCQNADFKSTGSEDLRHGWSCFREIKDRNIDSPWFQREDEFQLAIPNVSAFHWCPSFSLSNRSFI